MYHYYAALRLDRRASQCPSSWKRVEVNIEKGRMANWGTTCSRDGSLYCMVCVPYIALVGLVETPKLILMNSQERKLTRFRYQRQQALFIMHEVNKTFELPNSPSWYDIAAKSITKTVARLKGATTPPTQGPVRVSSSGPNCVTRINCTKLSTAANT